MREFSGRILAIDPESLELESDTSLDIHHVRMSVEDISDIIAALEITKFPIVGNYIFIWDVRHGAASEMSESDRHSCIRNEIVCVNQIVNSEWFRNNIKNFQLKINSSNLDLYELPNDTNCAHNTLCAALYIK